MTTKSNKKKEKTIFNSGKSTLVSALKKTGSLDQLESAVLIINEYIKAEKERLRLEQTERNRQLQIAESLLMNAKEKGLAPEILQQVLNRK